MNTNKWTTQIKEITDKFLTEFGGLTSAQLNFKPDEDTWSIAQNIEHLITVNRSYNPVIEEVRSNTIKLPISSKFTFIVNTFGKMVLSAVHPDRKKKMKTFKIWKPSESNVSGDILNEFKIQQDETIKLVEGCSDLLDSETVIYSPANNKIVYKLETAFDIIVIHEKRHFEQSKEVLDIIQSE